jgi:hypothetical protein
MINTIELLPAPHGTEPWLWLDWKMQLALLAGDYKLAICFHASNSSPVVEAELDEIARMLNNDGLCCELQHAEEFQLHVARNKLYLQQSVDVTAGTMPAKQAHALHGKLSGFPESAIQAFIADTCIKDSELPEIIRVQPAYVLQTFGFPNNIGRMNYK